MQLFLEYKLSTRNNWLMIGKCFIDVLLIRNWFQEICCLLGFLGHASSINYCHYRFDAHMQSHTIANNPIHVVLASETPLMKDGQKVWIYEEDFLGCTDFEATLARRNSISFTSLSTV